MNQSAATAVITGSHIILRPEGDFRGQATEPRPATLADADSMLAAHGYRRTAPWDLELDALSAPVAPMDNLFNGVRAARLDRAVGTTHEEWALVPAHTVRNGDLITDHDRSAIYVVAGSSTWSTGTKVHMVGEAQSWEGRFTGTFTGSVWVARKR